MTIDGRKDFDQLTAGLDASGRPYVLIMLDIKPVEGEMIEPGLVESFWRSTLSRGAAITALRGIAELLEGDPTLLEDV